MEEDIRELPQSLFPPLILETPVIPKKLYIRGTAPSWEENKFLAVVGSRKYSSYGREVCENLISGLRGYPIVIVSGLALGIDAIAHRAALAANLRTIAIPGSGLSSKVLYPSSHRGLAEEILENGGALISEFEPDFQATVWSFPQRNRIMAGMSHAVLIIEAEKKSGTLITARLALDYNRDVLTVPGNIFSKSSEGPHYLIRNGATPVTSKDDILEALGLTSITGEQTDKKYDDCSEIELKILEILSEPLPRDDLLRELDISISEANAALGILEIKGHITETQGEIRRT